MKNNNGFSLIELLAIIVIITILSGIGYMSYTSYIEKARKKAFQQSIDSVEMSVDFYIQENRSVLPVDEDQEVKIKLSKLKQLGYIKEDIYNNKKESCMDDSYIIIKYMNQNYTYTINMICGNTNKSININCDEKQFNISKDL